MQGAQRCTRGVGVQGLNVEDLVGAEGCECAKGVSVQGVRVCKGDRCVGDVGVQGARKCARGAAGSMSVQRL